MVWDRARGAKVILQFATSTEMPMLIWDAANRTGRPSNSAYMREVIAEALARDLDIPLEKIMENLPPSGRGVNMVNGVPKSTYGE